MEISKIELLLTALLLLSATSTQAEMLKSCNLDWSAQPGTNFAGSASCMITLGLDLVSNPGVNLQTSTPFVTDFMISVSRTTGALGDGSWGPRRFCLIWLMSSTLIANWLDNLVSLTSTLLIPPREPLLA